MLYLLRKPPKHAMSALHFTLRGREVFALFIKGLTGKRIEECLGMGINGVKRDKEKMLWQNDCETMAELIAKYRLAARENRELDQAPY